MIILMLKSKMISEKEKKGLLDYNLKINNYQN